MSGADEPVLQDLLLDPAERRGGIEPEFVGQPPPPVLVGLERIGVPACPVEGRHEQAAGALAFGVLADAFLVRMTLVPAVMALLGRSAWRLPKWLGRVLPDLDIEGEKLTRSLA
jgi:hypothetical protein